jgi:hypothetical protein
MTTAQTYFFAAVAMFIASAFAEGAFAVMLGSASVFCFILTYFFAAQDE